MQRKRLSIGGEIVFISFLAILLGVGGKVVRKDKLPFWGNPPRAKLIDLPEAVAEPTATHPDSLFLPSETAYRITLARAAGLYLQRKTLGICFLDARSPELYSEGHIAGALNFPQEHLEEYRDKVVPYLEQGMLIVIYCENGECSSAVELAEALLAEGFRRIAVFEGGWDDWAESGYPAAAGSEPGE